MEIYEKSECEVCGRYTVGSLPSDTGSINICDKCVNELARLQRRLIVLGKIDYQLLKFFPSERPPIL